MAQHKILTGLVAAGLGLSLAACGGPQGDPLNRAIAKCLQVTNAPGSYVASTAGGATPTVRAGEGGTARGAVLMEACVASELKSAPQAASLRTE